MSIEYVRIVPWSNRSGQVPVLPAPPVGDPVPAAPVELPPEPHAASRQARAAGTSRTGVACFVCMDELLARGTANRVPRSRRHKDGAAVTVPAECRGAPSPDGNRAAI